MEVEKSMDAELEPAAQTAEPPSKVRRHHVEELIQVLSQTGVANANVAARMAHVVEVLRHGFASGRKSIMLPVGGGLEALEAHLGLPAFEEDEAEWYRIRREFDESHGGVPATYVQTAGGTGSEKGEWLPT